MIVLLISLPILILLLSVGFIFVDFKKPSGWKIFTPILVFQLILLGLFIYLALLLLQDQKKLAHTIEDQEYQINKIMQTSGLLFAHLGLEPTQQEDAISRAKLYGLTDENVFFKTIDEADKLLQKLLEDNPGLLNRKKINVLQIPEDVNQELVAQTLHQYGFDAYYAGQDAQASEAKEMETEEDGALTLSLNFHPTVKSRAPYPLETLETIPTGNMLYLGKQVSTEEAKLAALILLRSGVMIKQIKRFRKHTRMNYQAIQVDYNNLYDKRPAMSAERIASAKGFR